MPASGLHRFVYSLSLLLAGFVVAWSVGCAPEDPRVYRAEPQGIMGTRSTLVVVAGAGGASDPAGALRGAEAQLRGLEGIFSTWIQASQMTRLNEAREGETVEVSPEVVQVLRLSERLFVETSGAFDVTAGPLIETWRQAAGQGAAPSAEALQAARASSRWHHFEIGPDRVVKRSSLAQIDLDGIAKGHAIDRALEVLQESGVEGGMVEVGGDLRVFGVGPQAGVWSISIRSPFENRVWARLEIAAGAVCSSGDYARFIEIDGKRYSHIIDPREGRPVEGTPTVTVVGPQAVVADAWATALSVLGPEGLDKLPVAQGFEAMVVSGSPESPVVSATPGFAALLVEAEFEPEIRGPSGGSN